MTTEIFCLILGSLLVVDRIIGYLRDGRRADRQRLVEQDEERRGNGHFIMFQRMYGDVVKHIKELHKEDDE